MKKALLITALAIAFIPLTVLAKNDKIEAFFEKYSEVKGVTYVNLTPTPELMEQASGASGMKEAGKMMKGIETMRVLTTEDAEVALDVNIYEDALKVFPTEKYKKFLEVKNEGTKVNMLYKGNKEKVSEYLILVSEDDKQTVVWMKGDLDLNQMSNLGKMMKGFSPQKGKENKGSDDK